MPQALIHPIFSLYDKIVCRKTRFPRVFRKLVIPNPRNTNEKQIKMYRALSLSVFVLMVSTLFSQAWYTESFDPQNPNFFTIQEAYQKNKQEYPNTIMGNKRFARWEWQNRGRIQEDGSIRSLNDTYNAQVAYEAENIDNNRSDMPTWWPLGPFTWTVPSSVYGNPGMGRINAIQVDPKNENVIYAASASGGIWKTIDGGQNWNTTMDKLTVLGTSDIAIDPSNSNIVYAATGDRDGLHTFGIGVLKSTDAGKTWTATELTSEKANASKIINRLAINPLNGNCIYAATPAGIYKTNNGGVIWDRVYVASGFSGTENFKNIMFHPTDTSILYASGTRLIITNDAGQTWTSPSSGLASSFGRAEIAVTPAEPNALYVLAADGLENFSGVFKSTDKGNNFTKVVDSTKNNILGYAEDGIDSRSQANYDLAIAVHPEDANHFTTGGINLWYTTNGGSNMRNYNNYQFESTETYVHADIHSLDYHNGKLYCGSDGGVYVSDDYGMTWKDLSANLNITQAYRIGLAKDGKLGVGTQDNGSNILTKDFNYMHIYGGDGMEMAIDPNDENIIYCESQFGNLQKSINGGETVFSVSPFDRRGSWVTPFIMNPNNSENIYIAYKDLWVTFDGGSSWDSLTTDNNTENMDAMEVSWSNPDYMYYAKNSRFYYSHDGGDSWDNISVGSYISDIFIHPSNPERVWISALNSKQVMYSNNGGREFVEMTEGLPNHGAETITMDIEDPNETLFVGLEVGIYYKSNNMTEWKPYGNNFPNVHVMELEIEYTKRRMKAATYGRGIWEIKIDGDNSIKESESALDDVQIYPIPSNEHFNIQFNLKESKDVELILWGPNGQVIERKQVVSQSINEKMTTKHLASGMYYLSIQLEGQTYNHMINVAH